MMILLAYLKDEERGKVSDHIKHKQLQDLTLAELGSLYLLLAETFNHINHKAVDRSSTFSCAEAACIEFRYRQND